MKKLNYLLSLVILLTMLITTLGCGGDDPKKEENQGMFYWKRSKDHGVLLKSSMKLMMSGQLITQGFL